MKILDRKPKKYKIKNGVRHYFKGSISNNRKANPGEVIVAWRNNRGVFYGVYQRIVNKSKNKRPIPKKEFKPFSRPGYPVKPLKPKTRKITANKNLRRFSRPNSLVKLRKSKNRNITIKKEFKPFSRPGYPVKPRKPKTRKITFKKEITPVPRPGYPAKPRKPNNRKILPNKIRRV